MKERQAMKKVVRNTVLKVQKMFRRKSNNGQVPNDNVEVEDGEEINEGRIDGLYPDDIESPEPLEIFPLSDDEDEAYPVSQPANSRQRASRGRKLESKDEAYVDISSDQEGACGPLVPAINNQRDTSRSTANSDRRIAPYYALPENTSLVVAQMSCGDMEKECAMLPFDLQAKVDVIRETLLHQYPPFYDFCVIASDDDYEEALQFKNYVALSFGLAGCTLYDGFISLGADLFDCYELMMDHSSKVFFFVTENFTDSAFCKRLQSGAVFLSLMSKAKKDREKCVPVFPCGFCRAPLALSGIAGLNPTQRDVTRRSLDNTYTKQLRHRRLFWDMENYEKRCIEFKAQVTKCITDYEANPPQIEAPPSPLAVTDVSDSNSFIQDNQISENVQNNDRSNSSFKMLSLGENTESVKERDKGNTNTHQNASRTKRKQSLQTSAQDVKDGETETEENSDVSDEDDVLKKLPIPEETRQKIRDEINNNPQHSVNITDCATVHVGPSIQVIIHQASPSDLPHVDKLINNSFSGTTKRKEEYSDSSD